MLVIVARECSAHYTASSCVPLLVRVKAVDFYKVSKSVTALGVYYQNIGDASWFWLSNDHDFSC